MAVLHHKSGDIMLHAIFARPVIVALRGFVISSALFTTIMAAEPTPAEPVEFDIDEQALASALHEFARQSDRQLLFATDIVEGKQAPLVAGVYEPEEALTRLLADTGLGYSVVANDTILVAEEERGDRDSGNGRRAGKIQRAATTAQHQTPTGQAERGGIDPAQTRNRDARNTSNLEEIVVTGTHIRGVDNVGAAAITFTREELDRTGYSTVEEFFESLPQNLDEISVETSISDGASRLAGANTQKATSVSLRGLGAGSTLILINGRRRPGNIRGQAVDISSIPFAMVERVEVVTGGNSAIYGSDAVAGAVNIVTRTDYDGAETEIYYGEPSAGGGRFNVSQTLGREFDKGGFVLGYDYRNDQKLDASDTGNLRTPSIFGVTPAPGFFRLRPENEQHSGLIAGHFKVNDNSELYADAQFSFDETRGGFAYTVAGCCDVSSATTTESDQYSVTGGLRLDVARDWQVDLSGLYGIVDNDSTNAGSVGEEGSFSGFIAPDIRDLDDAELMSFSAIADGPLGAMGNNTISAAIGVEFRNESYERTRFSLPDGTPTPGEDQDRDVRSMFVELHFPLIDADRQRLEASLAGRYDDYSDFGGTFNPQVSVEWGPIRGLTFRGTYSEAFRAPDLFTLGFAANGLVRTVNDPLDPTGMTTATLFIEAGGNPDLRPEEAETWTAGIDWEPSDRATVSLSYFTIDYEGRIDEPFAASLNALENESLLPGLINRNPTPEIVDAFLNRISQLSNASGIPFEPGVDDPFAIFPNIVMFDDRRNNIALEAVEGLDFRASTMLEARSGNWSFDLSGTYYLDFTRNITVTSPPIAQINEPGRPVDLKLRGRIGWSSSAWNVNAYVNYVDSYKDTIAAVPTKIDSWTTVDLTLRYDASQVADGALFNGVKATLGLNNVFNEDPPLFLSSGFGLGYDGVNANSLGRLVSLRLTKRW